jgi:hypothetical protein
MRITRDLLLRLAKENAEERAFNDNTIIAAYLTGSVLHDEPLLGNTTDIDLVFVHSTPVEKARELKALSPDVHLDIHHRNEKDYHPPRELRTNPWLGYELYDPQLLYETKHFFEFNQASLRAGFDEPKSVLKRSFTLLNHARKIWMNLQMNAEEVTPEVIIQYLDAVLNAANAVAEMTGPPLSERRLLLDFPARAEAVGHPQFTPGLFGLLGGIDLMPASLKSWYPAWKNFIHFASEASVADIRIHAERLRYYERALESILESETPNAAVYPMLLTWSLAAQALPENQIADWLEACEKLGFSNQSLEERLSALDHYMDNIEEKIESMLTEHGFELTEIM